MAIIWPYTYRNDRRDYMEQNLTILTERQRQVYLLRAQKLTFAEIGTQLGVSAAAAGSAYRAACRRLRKKNRSRLRFRSTAASWRRSSAPCCFCSATCAAGRVQACGCGTRFRQRPPASLICFTAHRLRWHRRTRPGPHAKTWNNAVFYTKYGKNLVSFPAS